MKSLIGLVLSSALLFPMVGPAQAAVCADPAVLVAGGSDGTGAVLDTAELYDVGSGTFTSTVEGMTQARIMHQATLLSDGRVLFTGGLNTLNGSGLSSAEIYNPSSSTFTTAGNMHADRWLHAATRLKDGNVLITGGFALDSAQSSAEIYQQKTHQFIVVGDMIVPRAGHTSTLLNNAKVLIANGENGVSAELFNPKTRSFVRTNNDMSMVHDTATLLANGQVLLAGRTGLLGNPGDLFNPATDTFRTTLGSMEFATNATTATLLENRQVLFTGGNAFRVTASIRALLYDPKTETFNPAVSGLTVPRVEHTATLLPNGKVLIVGGLTGTCNPSCVNGTTLFWNTAELYDPTAKTFSQVTGVMASPRFGHTATLICR